MIIKKAEGTGTIMKKQIGYNTFVKVDSNQGRKTVTIIQYDDLITNRTKTILDNEEVQ